MTLIAAFISPNMVRVVGDVLVTGEKIAPNEYFPHPTKLVEFGKGAGQVHALVQKIVVLSDQNILLWAGDFQKALKVIRILSEADRVGVRGDIRDLLSEFGLDDGDDEGLSLIQIEVGETEIIRRGLNVLPLQAHDGLLIVAGSGAEDFVTGFHTEEESAEPTWQKLMFNISRAMASEDFSDHPRASDYGGWFEVAEYQANKFVKLPLAFMRWDLVAENLVDVRSASSTYYVGHDLVVETAFYKDVPEIERAMRLISPDPLLRGSLSYEEGRDMQAPDRSYSHSFHVADGLAAKAIGVAYCGHPASDLTVSNADGLRVSGGLERRIRQLLDQSQRPETAEGRHGVIKL